MKQKKITQKIFLFLLALIGFLGMKGQLAGSSCTTATNLTLNYYPTLTVNTSTVGWVSWIPTTTNPLITLVNSNNDPSYKINRIDIYSGSCTSPVLVGSDVVLGSSDSTLVVPLNSLAMGQTYYIKLTRILNTSQTTTYEMYLKTALYCGFNWGLNPPTQEPNSPPGNYNNFNGGCMLDNTTYIAPSNTLLTQCTINTCQPNLYFGYSQSQGFPGFGNLLSTNHTFYVFPNVANTTYSLNSGSSNTVQINLSTVVGATQFTIISTYGCSALPITPSLTPADFAGCGCTQLVVNYVNTACAITPTPLPLCANQPFCFVNTSTISPLVYNVNQVTAGPTSYTQFPNGCVPNGLPVGQYTLTTLNTVLAGNGQEIQTCRCFKMLVINVNPNPGFVDVTASPAVGCVGQTSTLTAFSASATTYYWLPSNLPGNTTTVTINGNVVYTVVAQNNFGCSATNTILVSSQECCINPGVGNISFNNVTLVPFGTAGATAWTSLVANTNYGGINIAIPSSGIISGNFSVNGFLTIAASANVTFSNTNIYFGENAVVNQNATTVIDKSFWHGCDKNWQGIQSTKLLTVRNFVIEDASGAVVINATSANHPGLNVDNTIFNKNVYGMIITGPKLTSYKLTGSIFTSRDIPVANYVYTTGQRWTSLANFSSTALNNYSPGYLKGSAVMSLPNTARGQVGIYFGAASLLITSGNLSGNITIGDASTTPTLNTSYTNVFDYLRIGEYNSNSRLISYNNYFQWISSIPTSDLYGSSTACVYNNSTPRAVIGSNSTGTGLNIYTNNFINSTNGIFAATNGTLNVYNNQFTTITQYAVQIESWNCTNTQTVQIINNRFATCLYDLYAFNNNTIKLNFANSTSTYPFVAVKAKVTYHAYISEISSPASAKYYVGYSNSTGKVNGVYCINTYSPAVVNNTITIRTPIGAGFNANIWLDNTHQGDIKFNTLSVNPTNLNSYNTFNIFTNVGNNNLFCENYVTGAGSCMKFQGTSPSRIYRNNLNSVPTASCLYGIFLDNSGSVGPIKYNTSCAENIFGDFNYVGGGADTYAQVNSTGSTIDYPGAFSAANQYCPFVNLFSALAPPSTSFIPTSNASTGIAVCITQPVGAQMVQQNSTSSTSSPTLSAGVPVIMNSANNFSSNDPLMKKIANKTTFELAKKSAINTSVITGGTAFMNTNANNAIGSFYKMDSLVGLFAINNNTATLNQAKNLNTALVPIGVIETNQKTFNTVYHLFMKNENLITASHITTLKNLAVLCPFTDGTSVYQARALVKHFDTTEFVNPCENNPVITGSGNRLINTTDLNQSKEALSTLVYPNPAGNEITISTDVEGAKLLIFNIMGQVIIENELSALTKVNLSELKNGTYIYKIVKDNKIIKADKLIISK
ncbi:MAG: T9SS type A sorting domain-containing protein [Bacteroidetes bacterium]|nr:T9SS type A sorting domain-containing protein [Bacteroidota bacterium]